MPAEVVVVPHDPTWIEHFHLEAQRLLVSLGDNAMAVHHIGSTSLPGCFAKPIIDILVVVKNLNLVDEQACALESIGYEAKGEFGIPSRRYFRKENSQRIRTHHVHAYEVGNEQIARHLAFRDFLLAHPEWASKYSQLKQSLAATHPDSMADYIHGKNDFIQHIDRLAAAWITTTLRNYSS